MGGGLQDQLDRAIRVNDRLRRSVAAGHARRMNLTPGESALLAERYKPADIDTGWQPEAIRRWLDDQYAGAVYIGDDDDG